MAEKAETSKTGKTGAAGARPLANLLSGRRSGTLLMVVGVVMAALAWFLVVNTTRQAREAAAATAAAAETVGVRQVYAVMATKDIPQFTPIRADSVAVKAFPAAYAPQGVVASVDDVVGKFATTSIVKDQLVLNTQVSPTRRSVNLSSSIPSGKVAYWMPLPPLLAQTGGVQEGDHVDLLLTYTASQAKGMTQGQTTQTTLQNVEIFFIGSAAAADMPNSPAPGGQASGDNGGQTAVPGRGNVAAVLLDPQDAVMAKFIKDSGGTIDLVLRSKDDRDQVDTQPVTADALVDRFKFRVP